MTAEMTAWLREQLDADAAAAQAAYDEASDYEVVGSDLAELHFLNWKPDRVLADVAAKRAIVDEVARIDPYDHDMGGPIALRLAEDLVRHLASAYADRDGYREEWRPARSEA